jgi:hypothetical protein
MRGIVIAWTSLLVLVLPLSACGTDDSSAASDAPSPTVAASESVATSTSPTPSSSDRSPDQLHAGPAATLDACQVVTAALIKADFGADAGRPVSQPSSFHDPAAEDCFWFGDDVSISIQATSRADKDMPADEYTYAGTGQPVPGATRGWVKLLGDAQGSATESSSVILVEGQNGLNLGIQITHHHYDDNTLVRFAQDVHKNLG